MFLIQSPLLCDTVCFSHAFFSPADMFQSVLICPFSVASMKAVLSENNGLSCSCPRCPSDASYHWYYKGDVDGQPSHLKDYSKGSVMPPQRGAYACRAVWDKGMSFLSSSYVCKFLLMDFDISVTDDWWNTISCTFSSLPFFRSNECGMGIIINMQMGVSGHLYIRWSLQKWSSCLCDDAHCWHRSIKQIKQIKYRNVFIDLLERKRMQKSTPFYLWFYTVLSIWLLDTLFESWFLTDKGKWDLTDIGRKGLTNNTSCIMGIVGSSGIWIFTHPGP